MTSETVTTELAIRNETSAVMLTNRQLQMIASTEFVPKGLRGNVPAVLACVARGRSMGIPDMVALNGIAIIEGKATLSAELMEGIVRAHGHSITGTVTAESATLRGKRADNGDEMTAEFTLEMAERAGLLGKSNWKKHPDDMMFARAVSKLCRRLFADCFAGATYVPEEMEATADEVMDEPIGDSAPFDSGEIPTSEDEAELSEAAIPSTLEEFNQLKREANIPLPAVKGKAAELFPGKVPSDLSADELGELWAALQPAEVSA